MSKLKDLQLISNICNTIAEDVLYNKIKVIEDLEDLVTLFNMDYGIDVLGNIYENPELLEEL